VGPERSAKRNFGARMSTGHFVFIVDSDMELEPDVVEQCVKVVVDNPSVKAVVVPEKSVGAGFWTRCKALERSFYVGVDWMEAARFFDRGIFLHVGGYDEKNTGSEDYDLPQRIKQDYGQIAIGRVNAYATQHEGQISLLGMCRKKFYYAKSFIKYSRSLANAQTFQKQSGLLRRYFLFFSAPEKLFESLSLGLGMLFLKSCEFFAGGLGYFYYLLINRVFIHAK
jgi:glycosyltransferase involved in cell wall biosynthesis